MFIGARPLAEDLDVLAVQGGCSRGRRRRGGRTPFRGGFAGDETIMDGGESARQGPPAALPDLPLLRVCRPSPPRQHGTRRQDRLSQRALQLLVPRERLARFSRPSPTSANDM